MAKNNLKTILANETLTQSRLATLSGVSSSTVSKIYNGKKTPAPTTMGKLVNGLNKHVKAKRYKIKDVFPGFDGSDA